MAWLRFRRTSPCFHVGSMALLLLLLLGSPCVRAGGSSGNGENYDNSSEGRQAPQHMVIPVVPYSSEGGESNPQQASLDMEAPEQPVERLHSISQEELNALLGAAISADITTVRRIIQHQGISPEVHNILGWTPLNLAALAGSLEVVRFLILEAAANRETREIYGQTPLGSASINGHIEVVRFLLNLDPTANVAAQDLDGAHPLHYAAQFGYGDVCRALLEKGADANAAVPANGWTPFHSAAAAGQIDSLRVLLEFGADKERLDNEGKKPVQIIGVTLDVTKRRRRQLLCLLDPDSVFGGCGGHHGHPGDHGQGSDENELPGPPAPFTPQHVTPPGQIYEVTNGNHQDPGQG